MKIRKARGEDLEVNHFLDWNQTQIKAFFNFNPSDSRSVLQPVRSTLVGATPQSLDWRTLDRVTEVKNQK